MAFGIARGNLQGGNNSITNPLPATGSVAVQFGDLVVAVIAQQTALTVTAVTDNLGNTYTAQNAGTLSTTVISGRMFYARVTNVGTLTTVNFATTASANDAACAAVVYEGPFPASPIDTSPANITADITTPYNCPASGVLAQTAEIVIGWFCANSTVAYSVTAPFVKDVGKSQSANAAVSIASYVSSATTTQTPSWTGTAPTADVLGTASFKRNLLAIDQALTAPSVASTLGFSAPSIGRGLLATTFANTQNFFLGDPYFFLPVTIGAEVTDKILTPAKYTDPDSFFAPSIGRGPVTLSPVPYADPDTFYNATVAAGTVTLAPALRYVDPDGFFAPLVLQEGGPFILGPGLYSDPDSFFGPTVTGAAAGLAPSLYTDPDGFFTHVVSTGGVTLFPVRYTDPDTFFGATLTGGIQAAPGLARTHPFLDNIGQIWERT